MQKVAKQSGIHHIFDNTHAWGYDTFGDITIYSFSKSFSCPGGGAAVFQRQELYEKARAIQHVAENRFHKTVVNLVALEYMRALIKDRRETASYDNAREGQVIVKRFLSKAVRMLGLYQMPNFCAAPVVYRLYDTRMTDMQSKIAASKMERQEEVFAKRQKTAKLLQK